MPTLFLSDLHLSPRRPRQIALFKRFLAGPARQAEAVYILGDLFEQFWLGDDDRTPPVEEIMTSLRACAAHNPRLFFLRGNRDLMVGDGFARRSGCALLPDETVIRLQGRPALLMHGDLLCSDDRPYQRFRAFVEHPRTRRLFLSLPYTLRRLLAHGLRPLLKHSALLPRRARRAADVNPTTAQEAMQKHNTHLLIHGHTHRPAIHKLQVQGKPARRIVLGDWYENETQYVLVHDEGRQQLINLSQLLP